MKNQKFKEFKIPEKMLNELYEISGGPDAYKGVVVVYSTENGEPVVFTKCDSVLTEYGLHKALEKYLNNYSLEYEES
jgi:hypothetical protein